MLLHRNLRVVCRNSYLSNDKLVKRYMEEQIAERLKRTPEEALGSNNPTLLAQVHLLRKKMIEEEKNKKKRSIRGREEVGPASRYVGFKGRYVDHEIMRSRLRAQKGKSRVNHILGRDDEGQHPKWWDEAARLVPGIREVEEEVERVLGYRPRPEERVEYKEGILGDNDPVPQLSRGRAGKRHDMLTTGKVNQNASMTNLKGKVLEDLYERKKPEDELEEDDGHVGADDEAGEDYSKDVIKKSRLDDIDYADEDGKEGEVEDELYETQDGMIDEEVGEEGAETVKIFKPLLTDVASQEGTIFIDSNRISFSITASGTGPHKLFRRGYKPHSIETSMKETTAAAIVDLCHDNSTPLNAMNPAYLLNGAQVMAIRIALAKTARNLVRKTPVVGMAPYELLRLNRGIDLSLQLKNNRGKSPILKHSSRVYAGFISGEDTRMVDTEGSTLTVTSQLDKSEKQLAEGHRSTIEGNQHSDQGLQPQVEVRNQVDPMEKTPSLPSDAKIDRTTPVDTYPRMTPAIPDKTAPRIHAPDSSTSTELATSTAMASLLAGDPTFRVFDPFCGAGTLLIESALKYIGLPAKPLPRSFAFEQWPLNNEEAYHSFKDEWLKVNDSAINTFHATLRHFDPRDLVQGRGATFSGRTLKTDQEPITNTDNDNLKGLTDQRDNEKLNWRLNYPKYIGSDLRMKSVAATAYNVQKAGLAPFTQLFVSDFEKIMHLAYLSAIDSAVASARQLTLTVNEKGNQAGSLDVDNLKSNTRTWEPGMPLPLDANMRLLSMAPSEALVPATTTSSNSNSTLTHSTTATAPHIKNEYGSYVNEVGTGYRGIDNLLSPSREQVSALIAAKTQTLAITSPSSSSTTSISLTDGSSISPDDPALQAFEALSAPVATLESVSARGPVDRLDVLRLTMPQYHALHRFLTTTPAGMDIARGLPTVREAVVSGNPWSSSSFSFSNPPRDDISKSNSSDSNLGVDIPISFHNNTDPLYSMRNVEAPNLAGYTLIANIPWGVSDTKPEKGDGKRERHGVYNVNRVNTTQQEDMASLYFRLGRALTLYGDIYRDVFILAANELFPKASVAGSKNACMILHTELGLKRKPIEWRVITTFYHNGVRTSLYQLVR